MIALVEGAERRKTPNEIALNILLAGLTITFVAAVVDAAAVRDLRGHADLADGADRAARRADPDHDRRAALRDRHRRAWTASCSATCSRCPGRAVEASGDVDVLLLDKTGTITLGNRQAAEFLPVDGVEERELAEVAQLASLADETPEGRSIVVLAKERFGVPRARARRARVRPVQRDDTHERRQHERHDDPQGGRRRGEAVHRRAGRQRAGRARPDRAGRRRAGRDAARRLEGQLRARRRPSQGHRQGRHAASASTSCAGWASARS